MPANLDPAFLEYLARALQELKQEPDGYSPPHEIGHGGSRRRYFRLTGADRTIVAVLSFDPPADERGVNENETFFYVAAHLAACGVPVPRVLHRAAHGCFYLLEDAGDTLLYDLWQASPGDTGPAMDAYRAVIDRLAWMQTRATAGFDPGRTFNPPYTAAFARQMESGYFRQWFVACLIENTVEIPQPTTPGKREAALSPQERGRPARHGEFTTNAPNTDCPFPAAASSNPPASPDSLTPDDWAALRRSLRPILLGGNLDADLDALAVALEPFSETVFIHRDFQSQNIALPEGRPCFLDFQGARPGPPQYDLASLLFDPYTCLPRDIRQPLLEEYLAARSRLTPGFSPKHFMEGFPQVAAHRLMQALGAYGFLTLERGKPHFLRHVPGALAQLAALVKEYPAAFARHGTFAEFVCAAGDMMVKR